MKKVAINGFGRIGRNVMRAWLERRDQVNFEIVAINDLGDSAINAHLLKYDSVHGTLPNDIRIDNDQILIDDINIHVCNERDPAKLPWAEFGVDLVMESTGFFTEAGAARAHIEAGAKKVLISAPGKNVDKTVVYGVNHKTLTNDDTVVSNASCTTNCLAPLVSALHDTVGIKKGLANTIHAYTNDQRLSDVYHSDMMRARSATQSMIPTKTGAAAAVGEVIPEMKGKIDGLAVRVPLVNVSMLDFTFEAGRATTRDEINEILTAASEDKLQGVLGANSLPLVSIDFNHNPHSSIIDTSHTRVIDNQVKVLSWYDNEWGFSNRMLDTAGYMLALSMQAAAAKSEAPATA
ncbi:type I glyceraldehyde-3-phosphate dehydrogenase [Marinibactrum halimedae]|uniref:Glyceraldehyde-3-phosphate dehydrogenase n=1 Tax=Marinibactrum halimedae TaxID=1444977 RepID=A0AA37T551_9GAMM|nr:type I glyceraldehyde-3-phosphate dehydrogenase [Marinibactrum halimedae]MCD9460942.1 type I glyceraldehyde-3-phosphate dehydrogenase [Marinibactrum halimedae]GLS27413.1 glyceraldehyde-3-phosphate dehydrogenase [Marinibactrum halimedae]